MGTVLRGHARIDARSLAMHQAIADKLRAQPELVEVGRSNLQRWMTPDNRSNPYFEEWLDILSRPLEQILALLVEESQHMTALRQIHPFAGVLTPQERWAIYREFQEEK